MKGSRVYLYLLRLLAGILLTDSLLAGCTVGPVEEIVPEESLLVGVSFGKPDLGVPELLTRAGEEVTPTPLPEGSTVRICAYLVGNIGDTPGEASFSTTAPSHEATYVVGVDGALTPCSVDEDGKKIAGAAKVLTVRGGIYDFYAVSPARLLRKGDDANYKIMGIPHKEDVMISSTRGVAVTKNSRQVTLATFSRKCAQVVFNVASSPDNTVPFIKLYGTGLTIKKISSSSANLIVGNATGIVPTGGSDGLEAQVTFSAAEFEAVEPGSDPHGWGLNKTKGVVLPKNNQPFDVEITVVRDDETATLKATIDKNISFDEGKRYIFTLEVKNNESSLLMKVFDWNSIVFTDENVGAPDNPYPDPDINEGIGTTITVATWNNIPWSGNGEIGGEAPVTLTIDQVLADAYKNTGKDLSTYPPFNYDNGDVTGVGSDYKGVSSTCTISTPYTIEVESTQSSSTYVYDDSAAKNYCTSKGSGWRLPTMIELFGMWTKCRGTNNDVSDGEDASSALGAPFVRNWYWSSSVFEGSSDSRCRLSFVNGNINSWVTSFGFYVRCVRENSPIEVDPSDLPAHKGGEKVVQITARPGQEWVFAMPSWLSALLNGEEIPSGATITHQGPVAVLFKAAEANPKAEKRSVSFTVGVNGTDQDITITQSGSTFTVNPTEIILGNTATSGSVTVTGTSGLPWTVSPSVATNGITPATSSSTATGSGQTLTFNADENIGDPREATFTVAVTGGDHSKTVTVKQAGLTGNYVMIDQALADAYKNRGYNLSYYPPFNYDNGDVTGVGSDYKGVSSTCTISTPYTIEVESTQSSSRYKYDDSTAKNYCTSKGSGWRLPTNIELFAMWIKCKGTNDDASDAEGASSALGAPFVSNNYWSSSAYNGNGDSRCITYFGNGYFSVNYSSNLFVRCVREN